MAGTIIPSVIMLVIFAVLGIYVTYKAYSRKYKE